jgi:ribosomal-protein-alanine acetyltransferase
MSEVIIRTARLDDADAIIRIDQASFSDPWGAETMFQSLVAAQSGDYIAFVAEASKTPDFWRRCLQTKVIHVNKCSAPKVPSSSSIPTLSGPQLCGFVIAWNVREEGEIATLAVDEPFRGQGIAQHLLEAALHEATRRGAKLMFLEVRPDNIAALHLYEKCGFQKVGLRKNYYRNGDDAVVMRRQSTE